MSEAMAKLVLSARLVPRREDGVDADIAEFPDIKVSAWSVGVALARLREAVWQRLRWTKVETSCAGEPISPIPQKPTSGDLLVAIQGPDRAALWPGGSLARLKRPNCPLPGRNSATPQRHPRSRHGPWPQEAHYRALDCKLASTNRGHLPSWLGSVPVPGQSPKR
jgi:hypothetical protein